MLLWRALADAGCVQGDPPGAGQVSQAVDGTIRFVAMTPAPLAILPVEDALGLHEQPNLPGTIDTHPNWRRRLPQDVEQVLDEPAVANRLSDMNRARSRKAE
jgi:4-alpha-glucanotransferase